MTREIWPSFFVAMLFAVHPLHVESVAWVAERKDVMSAFFWLLTTGFYLRYVRAPLLSNYIPVVVSLALGLMAKPMLVTLPFALLLVDFWPLRRVQTYRSWIPLVKEKIPLIVLVLISIILTIWSQRSGGAIVSLDLKPLPMRIENAVISYGVYLYKFFWPVGLSVFYPYSGSFSLWQPVSALIILGGSSWFAWRFRNRFPYALTGWLWFLGTLVPVIGIVQVGGQALADRYTYIPSIGFFIIIAWSVKDFLSLNALYGKSLALSGMSAVIIVLSVLCYLQVQQWKNGITLFQHALNVQENNFLAHGCLGAALIQHDQPEQAEKHLLRSLELNPRNSEALNDLGTILTGSGRYQEAITHFSNSIALTPQNPEAHNNLALTLTYVNRFPEAIEQYRIAISLNPMFPKALNNLGAALAQQGRFEDAKPYFLRALMLKPDYDTAYCNLGALYYQQQDYPNSEAYFESGLRYNANNPKAYFFLGLIASAQGRDGEAANRFSQALKLDPNFREAEENLRNIQEKYQQK